MFFIHLKKNFFYIIFIFYINKMIDPQRGGNRVGGGGVANEFLENVD
jgi:hypothetical protein